jgi:hypothetical protein
MLWSKLRSWLETTLRRSRMESDMDEELRFHIEACTEDLVRSGLAREEVPARHARRPPGRVALGMKYGSSAGLEMWRRGPACWRFSWDHRSTPVGACKPKRLKQLHRQILRGSSHWNHRQQTVRSHANHRNIAGGLVHGDQ